MIFKLHLPPNLTTTNISSCRELQVSQLKKKREVDLAYAIYKIYVYLLSVGGNNFTAASIEAAWVGKQRKQRVTISNNISYKQNRNYQAFHSYNTMFYSSAKGFYCITASLLYYYTIED